MKQRGTIALLLLFLCGLSVHGAPPAKTLSVHTAQGAERKAILDALRTPIEKVLKQKVVFKVDRLSVGGDWAFTEGLPQHPDGSRIDYHKTQYADDLKEGTFDDGYHALLHRVKGKWVVTTYNLGATDVCWVGWDKEYHAPRAIFPPYSGQ